MTGPQRPIHVDDEEWVAAEMGRELDELAGRSGIVPPAGFTDSVMAAIRQEPLPQPARAFGAALAGRRLGAAIASVADAWRVVIGGSTPLAVRAQALALVLVVTVGSLAVAGGAAVGAIDLLNATQAPHPSPTTPLPNELQSSPSPSPSPSPSASPMTSDEPSTEAVPTADGSETPEGTDSQHGTGNPGATHPTETNTPSPTASDDHGGGDKTPRPTESDDHGGGGSGGGETPEPTATADHGGDG